MKCQSCEKNPATVHLTEITEEGKSVFDLCEDCASKKGIVQGTLPSILKELVEGPKEGASSKEPALRCPECGITFEQFREKGRFGCPRDYDVFAKELTPLLEKVHGAVKHVGRFPRGTEPDTAKEERLRRLRRDLAKAVKDEQYEEAARLRDEIRASEEALRGAR
jgi:protein arginine kinase activator